jgi:hypothetical protein
LPGIPAVGETNAVRHVIKHEIRLEIQRMVASAHYGSYGNAVHLGYLRWRFGRKQHGLYEAAFRYPDLQVVLRAN